VRLCVVGVGGGGARGGGVPASCQTAWL
jgi:hypothetical protein